MTLKFSNITSLQIKCHISSGVVDIILWQKVGGHTSYYLQFIFHKNLIRKMQFFKNSSCFWVYNCDELRHLNLTQDVKYWKAKSFRSQRRRIYIYSRTSIWKAFFAPTTHHPLTPDRVRLNKLESRNDNF